MDVEDGGALGGLAPTVEELKHFRLEAAVESLNVSHATDLA